MKFKLWIEDRQEKLEKQVEKIWKDTIKLLVGGQGEEDAATKTLKQVTQDSSPTESPRTVVRHLLANNQVFNRLQQLGDPDIAKDIEKTQEWLDQAEEDRGEGKPPAKKVSTLLQYLFGNRFGALMGKDVITPETDTAKAQVPPMSPKQDVMPPQQDPTAQVQTGQEPAPIDAQLTDPMTMRPQRAAPMVSPMALAAHHVPEKPPGAKLLLF